MKTLPNLLVDPHHEKLWILACVILDPYSFGSIACTFAEMHDQPLTSRTRDALKGALDGVDND